VVAIAYSVKAGESSREAEALWTGVLEELAAKKSAKAGSRLPSPEELDRNVYRTVASGTTAEDAA
jgi:hypothetical protein